MSEPNLCCIVNPKWKCYWCHRLACKDCANQYSADRYTNGKDPERCLAGPQPAADSGSKAYHTFMSPDSKMAYKTHRALGYE